MQTILQIPVKKDLRDRAVRAATLEGFSSLQEAVRVFLNKFAAHKVSVSFTASEVLSEEHEERYAHMLARVASGKVKTKKFTTADALIQHLRR